MFKIKKVTTYLLIIAVIVASIRISIFSLRFLLGSDYPLVVVEGQSMEPTYYDGDLLAVKGVDDKFNIKPPDIIVFHEPTNRNRLIVHRVIQQIVNDGSVEFVTKGDHNPISDYDYWKWRVRETDVVGVVIVKLPPIAGYIVADVESQAITIFTVAIIIIVIGADIIYDRKEGKTSL
jgi:signal peptidase I